MKFFSLAVALLALALPVALFTMSPSKGGLFVDAPHAPVQVASR